MVTLSPSVPFPVLRRANHRRTLSFRQLRHNRQSVISTDGGMEESTQPPVSELTTNMCSCEDRTICSTSAWSQGRLTTLSRAMPPSNATGHCHPHQQACGSNQVGGFGLFEVMHFPGTDYDSSPELGLLPRDKENEHKNTKRRRRRRSQGCWRSAQPGWSGTPSSDGLMYCFIEASPAALV